MIRKNQKNKFHILCIDINDNPHIIDGFDQNFKYKIFRVLKIFKPTCKQITIFTAYKM